MTEKKLLIPAREARAEILVVNSRFIATAAPVFSPEEARGFIQRIRAEFADASHNVPAFLIGHGSNVMAHCSDDGEPSGTAGRPVLAVLQGSGLGDAAVVVTRYFGGTKLGTGGLVRAYGDAAKSVLAVLPRAERIPTHTIMAALPYSYFERLRILIERYRGQILDEDFGADVTITARFAQQTLPEFQNELTQLTNGTVAAEIIESDENTIFPVTMNTGAE